MYCKKNFKNIFSNNILIQWGSVNLICGEQGIITLPLTYISNLVCWCCKTEINAATSVSVIKEELSQITVANRYYPGVAEGTPCRAFAIGI